MVVVERLASEEVPVSDTVVEVEYELSDGVEMFVVGLVVSNIIATSLLESAL